MGYHNRPYQNQHGLSLLGSAIMQLFGALGYYIDMAYSKAFDVRQPERVSAHNHLLVAHTFLREPDGIWQADVGRPSGVERACGLRSSNQLLVDGLLGVRQQKTLQIRRLAASVSLQPFLEDVNGRIASALCPDDPQVMLTRAVGQFGVAYGLEAFETEPAAVLEQTGLTLPEVTVVYRGLCGIMGAHEIAHLNNLHAIE